MAWEVQSKERLQGGVRQGREMPDKGLETCLTEEPFP